MKLYEVKATNDMMRSAIAIECHQAVFPWRTSVAIKNGSRRDVDFSSSSSPKKIFCNVEERTEIVQASRQLFWQKAKENTSHANKAVTDQGYL